MAIVTVDDVRADLAGIEFDNDTEPTLHQVMLVIDEIESEVRSYVAAYHGQWPDDPDSNAWKYLKRTILEGVAATVLKSKYAMNGELPDSVRVSRNNYNDRIRRLEFNLRLPMLDQPGFEGRYAGPVLTEAAGAPDLSGDLLTDWTLRRSSGAGMRTGYPT